MSQEDAAASSTSLKTTTKQNLPANLPENPHRLTQTEKAEVLSWLVERIRDGTIQSTQFGVTE